MNVYRITIIIFVSEIVKHNANRSVCTITVDKAASSRPLPDQWRAAQCCGRFSDTTVLLSAVHYNHFLLDQGWEASGDRCPSPS